MGALPVIAIVLEFCRFAFADDAAQAAKITADEAFFAKQIRPVLEMHCWKCHGASKTEGGLRLDSRSATLRGGDSGPAMIVGNPQQSRLIQAIRQTGEIQMPPDGRLPMSNIEDFITWIRQGAIWPRAAGESQDPAESIPWSFRPLRIVQPPPDTEGWSGHPIDCFLRLKHREAGLTVAAAAEARTLIRRLTFNLTGLPAAPEEVDAYLADCDTDVDAAYQKLMERLLASPAYGEHWGRHWLDVVRYADTAGFEVDGLYRSAWRYRDYVIRAFQSDKPFDRFVREQIAGDELWPDDPDAVLATGLYCVGPMAEESVGVADQLEYEWLIDSVDTTAAAFLGLSAGCARCHHHKYDPLTQHDYFAMQAIFAASDRPYVESVRERRIKALNGLLSEGPPPETLKNDPRCLIKVEDQVGLRLFHRDQPLEIHRLHRGELGKRRELSEPAVPVVLRTGKDSSDLAHQPAGQRRQALAQWITSADNPLTARVIVNRVWGWHFGQGLVRTSNEFGNQGALPTHPELLDWLAADLISHGWSLKHLQRRILSSRTYRLQSQTDMATMSADPENRLLCRFPRRRLSAEEIRDATLACAGTLNRQEFGRPVVPPLNKQELSGLFGAQEKWPVTGDASQHTRRSVYLLVRRTFAVPLLATFDPPEMMSSCARRDQTVVPAQALALLNSPLVREQAGAFARRVLAESHNELPDAIARSWTLAFGRPATDTELRRSIDFVRHRSTAIVRQNSADHPGEQTGVINEAALSDLCLALLNSNEFIYVD